MRRESTEELLRESEESYRRLSELSPDAIAVQSEGKVAYVNAAGLKLLGATCLEEVLGRPVVDFIHPDFRETARARIQLLEEGWPAALMEQRWVRPDGQVVDVEVASAPITYQGRPSSQIVARDVTERKRMEGELREAEAKYRRLVEQIPAATYQQELGEGTAIIYVSPQIEAITGYSPEEYVSDPTLWVRIIHPDDRERVMDEDARVSRSGEPFRMEYRMFARDDRVVWVRDEAIVVDDETGEPLYWQGIILNITESKMAEQGLRRSEARNRAILNAGPDLMFLFNRAGEFLDFRAPDTAELYVPSESIVGSKLVDVMPAEVTDKALHSIRRALDSGETQTFEYELRAPEGLRQLEARLVKSGADEVLAVVRDITERKRAELALKESEQRFRQLFNQSVDALFVHDEKGKVVDCNEEACHSTGYTRKELLTLSVSDLTDDLISEEERKEREREGGTLWQRIVAGEPVTPAVAHFGEHKRKDGTKFPIEVRVGGVDYRGRRMILASVRDITERKRAEEAMRASEERYRAVVEQSTEAIWVFDPDTKRVLESNTSFQELLGYTAEELQHLTNYDFVAHSRENVDAAVARIVQNRRGFFGERFGERKYRCKDGTVLDVEASGTVIPYGDKEAVCGVVRDMTEIKRVEAALKESEESHRQQARELSLLHQVRTALARELDLPAVFRVVVEAIADTYGYAQVSAYFLDGEELKLQHQVGYDRVIERVHISEGVMGRVARTGEPVLLEDVRAEPAFLGAIEGVVSEVCVPLFDEDGVVGTLNVESTDGVELTEDDLRLIGALGEHAGIAIGRARLYTRVRESEERFRSLIQNASDVITLLDADGTIRYESPSIERILGYRPEELIGKNAFDYVHPEDLERVLNAFTGGLANPEFPRFVECRFRCKDGSWRHLESVGNNLLDDPGVGQLVVNSRDITERKQAEQVRNRLAAIVQSSEDAILSRTRDGVITSWNKGAEKLYGYTAEEVVGRSGSFLYLPEHPEEMSEILEKIQRGESIEHYETERMTKSGRRVCVSLSVSPIRDASGNIIGDSGIARDITERKRTEEALRESEERYRAVIEQSAEAIWLFDPDTKRVLESNPSFQQMLGYTAEELREMTNYDFVAHSREDIDALVQLKVREGKSLPSERKYRRKDGTLLDVEVGGAMISYQSKRVVCSVARDLTERKAMEEKLTYRAFHDPLTDLPNRALFLDRLQHALARAGRQMSSIAVLYVDLDNFKIINDSLGHEMGDRVLVEAGRRLRSCLRPADTVARLGGDEFIVLLENNAGVREATWISERILEKFRSPLLLEGQETFITPSIGIFLAGPDNLPEEILRNADLAMYRAKEKGKAQYEVFDLAMYDRTLERRKLEVDLKQGVERGELRVYYQPKVRLDTGKIIGMEALVRWDHPGLGIVLPEEFIPVAEETGLIIPLGQWILEEACEQGREWQAQYPGDPPLEVCVNLSARQFQRHDLVKEIAGVLKETGLDPRSLVLEITESVIMDEAESSIAILEKLKDLGVQLAIDDFGTGYSSLSYLNRFPVDSLKIDRSFIEGLPEGPEDTAVVSSIITLTHTLGMQVTAEGVETDQQLSQLRNIGCDLAQGLCFAEPLACEAASALLADDPRW